MIINFDVHALKVMGIPFLSKYEWQSNFCLKEVSPDESMLIMVDKEIEELKSVEDLSNEMIEKLTEVSINIMRHSLDVNELVYTDLIIYRDDLTTELNQLLDDSQMDIEEVELPNPINIINIYKQLITKRRKVIYVLDR